MGQQRRQRHEQHGRRPRYNNQLKETQWAAARTYAAVMTRLRYALARRLAGQGQRPATCYPQRRPGQPHGEQPIGWPRASTVLEHLYSCEPPSSTSTHASHQQERVRTPHDVASLQGAAGACQGQRRPRWYPLRRTAGTVQTQPRSQDSTIAHLGWRCCFDSSTHRRPCSPYESAVRRRRWCAHCARAPRG